MPFPFSYFSTSRRCAGMTLLEVLVACGILILGLSGIAALLPAASFQLSQAATEDRAGVLAANARSEVLSRRLSASALSSNHQLAVPFGPGLTDLASVAPAWFATPVAGSLTPRIDGARGFLLEDDLAFQMNAMGDSINTFANGTTGPRQFKERICWAGLLLPGMRSDGAAAAETSAGQPVTLAIATLRKAPDAGRGVKLFSISAPANAVQSGSSPPPGICFTISAQDLGSESDRKQFLGPCSWVLVLPILPGTQTGSAPIRPVQINSSWTLPNGGSSSVALRIPEDLASADPLNPQKLLIDRYRTVSGGIQQLRVVGIANLIRLDQHHLTLD